MKKRKTNQLNIVAGVITFLSVIVPVTHDPLTSYNAYAHNSSTPDGFEASTKGVRMPTTHVREEIVSGPNASLFSESESSKDEVLMALLTVLLELDKAAFDDEHDLFLVSSLITSSKLYDDKSD